MRNLLIGLIGLLFFIGCSKSWKDVSPEPWPNWWDGYLQDTTGLSIQYHEFVGNNLKIAGIKSGKLWLSIFNTESKEKIFDFIDNENFKSPRTFDKGYGEFETINMKVHNFVVDEMNPYKRMFVVYTCEMTILDLFILNQQNNLVFKVLAEKNIHSANFSPWFENRFIVWSNPSLKYCYSDKGESLFSLEPSVENLSKLEPINLKEGIWINHEHSYRINIETGEKKWKSYIYNDIQINAKVAMQQTKKEGNDWFYTLDITNYDGSKETKNFKINIETGEIVKL